ncbi:MAG: NADP-dependent oxidoreductase [Burkholderiales bacterium]
MKNRQIVLAHRPHGWVQESDFRLVESETPEPQEGEAVVRNRYLSLDPYMRMRMSDAPSYAPSVGVGEVMVGGTIGEVVASRSPLLAAGDTVTGPLGWQLYGVAPASRLRRIENPVAPLSAYLGVLGMPGITAWVGLELIGPGSPGQTLVVSAASGAVGSVAGQIGRIRGCSSIGIAGGAQKCRQVEKELGFDACVDYREPDLSGRLRAAAAKGIDVYFENVGGSILDAVLELLNPFARIALCGQVSQYNLTEPYGVRNLRSLLVNRVLLRGYIVSDHMDLWPRATAELTGWVREGTLRYHETVAHGLPSAPKAFIAMLRGDKLGKQVVELDDDG